jgi:predicted amidohydrolase
MKVAAYQAPLDAVSSLAVLDLIREQVDKCEARGVGILCCPEGVLGGLADYVNQPTEIAIDVKSGQLETLLSPLASDRVTIILGFTEIDRGRLYNSAAVFHRGKVAGIYRKVHPAIHRSVYWGGDEAPVFTACGLTFGIIICRDSNFPEPARSMAAQGAAALFVPSNNGLPPEKGGPELIDQARNADIARATENGVFVIRADVAGRAGSLVSHGSSRIVDPDGRVLQAARQLGPDLLVADIEVYLASGGVRKRCKMTR